MDKAVAIILLCALAHSTISLPFGPQEAGPQERVGPQEAGPQERAIKIFRLHLQKNKPANSTYESNTEFETVEFMDLALLAEDYFDPKEAGPQERAGPQEAGPQERAGPQEAGPRI